MSDTEPRDITFRAWRGAELADGTHQGTAAAGDGLRLTSSSTTRTYTDPFGSGSVVTYDVGTWSSPVVSRGMTSPSSWLRGTPRRPTARGSRCRSGAPPRRHYPRWDNGGEAWCSPTSTSMVLGFWGTGPSSADTAWVDPPVDPQVDHAARNVFDYRYDGGGNWPFNAAYAAGFGLEGFVTRLRSLAEAEAFIAAGIPLVASVSFKDGKLDGAGYSTNGHLLVIRGFTRSGDVIVNDPASHLIADDTQVPVIYDREQFENTWVPHSGGIVYVIHPSGHPLPARLPQANW